MSEQLDKRDIPVVILCGGFGTRLRGAVEEEIPKPLVPVGDFPILWHVMKVYGAQGFRRFVLCLGYKSWTIKQYFMSYREQQASFSMNLGDGGALTYHDEVTEEDWEITFAETGLATQTGGRLSRIRRYIDTETFAFTYADSIGAIDLDAQLAVHRASGRIGTVTGVNPVSRYGEIVVEGTDVVEFNEKPTVATGRISGGFFLFQREIFDYVHDGADLVFETGPLPKLARDGQLSMYEHNGFWRGMDTYREYKELNDLWAADEAPWKIW